MKIEVDPSIEREELLIIASASNHAKIKVKYANLQLQISSNTEFDSTNNVKVLLRAKSLESICNNAVGNIKGIVNTKNLVVKNTNVGNIKIEGTCKQLDIYNEGVGNVDTLNLHSDCADIVNSGIGNVLIYSKKILRVANSGVGKVSYCSCKIFGQ